MIQEILNAISEFWSRLGIVIGTFGVVDLLDVLVVAFLLYHAIRLVRETRAMQLVKGIGIVILLYIVAANLKMITLNFIITNILQWGIVALAVVFQPELRRALEQVGRSKITDIGRIGGESAAHALLTGTIAMIEAVVDSAELFSERKTGALMVIERQTRLGDIISRGTIIDSSPSVALIANLFYPNTPLHDGAMILRDGRLYAAGCVLPLTENADISLELGTRHRAALGVSEVSDAMVVVVSEETGAISVAMDGKLQRGLSPQNLQKLLTIKLVGQDEDAKKSRKPFWRKKS